MSFLTRRAEKNIQIIIESPSNKLICNERVLRLEISGWNFSDDTEVECVAKKAKRI